MVGSSAPPKRTLLTGCNNLQRVGLQESFATDIGDFSSRVFVSLLSDFILGDSSIILMLSSTINRYSASLTVMANAAILECNLFRAI